MKTKDIDNDEIIFSDEELKAMASFAAFIDENVACDEAERNQAYDDDDEAFDREAFDELRDCGDEIERIFGKDNFMDDLILFDKIFISALRQYGEKETEQNPLDQIDGKTSASDEADERQVVNG